jgi:hypothetical protein
MATGIRFLTVRVWRGKEAGFISAGGERCAGPAKPDAMGGSSKPRVVASGAPGQRHLLNFPHVMPAAQHEIDFPEQFRILLKKRR